MWEQNITIARKWFPVLTFEVEDGRLVLRVPGLPRSVLSALSETKFYARSKGDVTLTFVAESDSSVNTIELVWAGYPLRAERIHENA